MSGSHPGPILGLDAEHTAVVMPLGDLDQGAEFAVFVDEADAQANEADASALIGVSPTELTGNVVWGFDAAADETPDDQAAVEGCLPQPNVITRTGASETLTGEPRIR